jgi:hypothetical protein
MQKNDLRITNGQRKGSMTCKDGRHSHAGLLLPGLLLFFVSLSPSRVTADDADSSVPESASTHPAAGTGVGPESLGIFFVSGSTSTVIVEKGDKKYLVDLVTHSIREAEETPAASMLAEKPATDPPPAAHGQDRAQAPEAKKPGVYTAGDDFVFSLPTGRRIDRHGLYVNFTHRFAFNTAFSGRARGHVLSGLDDFALASFGFRFGLTEKASIGIYRSPSVLGRPIQLQIGYNLLDEQDGNPINAAVRLSVEGQNDFSRNYTTSFEGILSRSITRRAQIYFVPTVSIHARPLTQPNRFLEDPPPLQPCQNPVAAGVGGRLDIRPCANTFSLGVGGALDIRPTVALVAEVIPILANGRELGVHRPAYSFGIQKKIWRHAFTFGFSNSPGTTVSQRAGTRATMLGDPTADTPGGLFVSFDLMRQMR